LKVMGNKTHLLIELFDDRKGAEEPEYLGEIEWDDLPLDSVLPVSVSQLLPLQINVAKSLTGFTQGSLLAGYTWTPEPKSDDGFVRGNLQVSIERAEGVWESDWKKNGVRDVFAVVYCWPKPPIDVEVRGVYVEDFKTKVVSSLNPAWNESASFDYDWPRVWKAQRTVGGNTSTNPDAYGQLFSEAGSEKGLDSVLIQEKLRHDLQRLTTMVQSVQANQKIHSGELSAIKDVVLGLSSTVYNHEPTLQSPRSSSLALSRQLSPGDRKGALQPLFQPMRGPDPRITDPPPSLYITAPLPGTLMD